MPISYQATVLQPGYAAGDRAYPAGTITVTDRTPGVSARVTAWPFSSSIPLTIDRIGVYLTTPQTGAACRVGAYGSNRRGRLGALLLDAGELSLASGSGEILATVNFQFTGLIWVVVWMKNVATQATVKGISTAANQSWPQPGWATSSSAYNAMSLASAYPANLPTTAPAVTPANYATTDPIPVLRVA